MVIKDIYYHINNIYRDEELEKISHMQKLHM